ncbi:MAG: hypothetical protein K2W95_04415 [Candidatus Obscuribacterales bacterium]|nr:hypothetical protein [Candidatus Obscuribacterales bacterium]
MILSALYAHETISSLLLARPQHRNFQQPSSRSAGGNKSGFHNVRSTVRKSLAIAALFGLTLTTTAGLAESSQLPDSGSTVTSLVSVSQAASQELTQDGFEFLKEMAEAANALKTYSFQSEQTVFKGNKTVREKVNFYFKKPKLIRAEEVGDYKKGSVAVLQKNGTVRGHLGGLLSKISATVAADSEWVLGANGYPLADSDFFSMSQVMVNFVKNGKKSLVTGSPVRVTGQPKPVYIIELYTDTSKKQLMKRAYIDPENLLPVEWFDYKDGKLFAHTNWRNLHLNTELNDSLFQL